MSSARRSPSSSATSPARRVWVELWAGNAEAAAEYGAEGWRLHQELGESSWLTHAAANLARALYALDRLDDADAWAVRAAELSSEPWTEMLWRQVRAKVHARRGEHADAERLCREAVAICDDTQMLDGQGDAYADLGEVLVLADRTDEAIPVIEEALERYERKGNLVMVGRVRARLAELRMSRRSHDGVSSS